MSKIKDYLIEKREKDNMEMDREYQRRERAKKLRKHLQKFKIK